MRIMQHAASSAFLLTLTSGLCLAGPVAGGPGTASLKACHESLLRQHYYPAHATLPPVHLGGQLVITNSGEVPAKPLIAIPANGGLYVYDSDSSAKFYPLPPAVSGGSGTRLVKLIYKKRPVYLELNTRSRIDHITTQPRQSGSYAKVSPAPSSGFQAAAKADVGEFLDGACDHLREEERAEGISATERKTARSRFETSMTTCAAVEDQELAAKAASALVQCGFLDPGAALRSATADGPGAKSTIATMCGTEDPDVTIIDGQCVRRERDERPSAGGGQDGSRNDRQTPAQ